MRSEKNGLRAQTTTSPLGCEVSNIECFIRAQREKKPPTIRRVCFFAGRLRSPVKFRACFTMVLCGRGPLLMALPLWLSFGQAGEL